MATIDVTRDAKIVVICGGPGCGKSALIKQQIRREKRVTAWDPDGEYGDLPGWTTYSSGPDFVRALAAAKEGKIAYSPLAASQDAFNLWALAAFAWGSCVAVAEETADVTTPSKAPPGWGQLVRKGRKRGVTIYAVTQRPSESDKTVMGCRTMLRVHAMERDADRDYIAREIGRQHRVKLDSMVKLDFLEKHAGSQALIEGRVKFR